MDSDSSWMKVGKGGRHIPFPPDAAAVFGSKARSRPKQQEHHTRAEFPTDAAAAFGRSGSGSGGAGGRNRPSEASHFDSSASAAFGSKARSGPREFDSTAAAAFGSGKSTRSSGVSGVGEFDTAAASAFGGRKGREDFPDAFGKKKSAFSTASEFGFCDPDSEPYAMSALAKKRAAAAAAAVAKPPEPKTFDEMFPVLGAPAKKTSVGGGGAGAGAGAAKPSFADLMRKRAADEEEEERRKAQLEAEEKRAREEARRERDIIHRLHAGLQSNRVSHDICYDEEDDESFMPNVNHDLDTDVYGVTRREAVAATYDDLAADESEHSEDDAGEEDAWHAT